MVTGWSMVSAAPARVAKTDTADKAKSASNVFVAFAVFPFRWFRIVFARHRLSPVGRNQGNGRKIAPETAGIARQQPVARDGGVSANKEIGQGSRARTATAAVEHERLAGQESGFIRDLLPK